MNTSWPYQVQRVPFDDRNPEETLAEHLNTSPYDLTPRHILVRDHAWVVVYDATNEG
jgi:hypothetical protein